jgi:DNA-binding transcriptional LysR family regulator
MRLFTRIVDRRSFTRAAEDMGIPRATVTRTIMQMEERLGARLLQRTTRQVRPTLDGEAYYRRCLAILDDVEDADGAFSDVKPRGLLRVEVQGTLARHFLMPRLPDFLARYPDLELSISEGERWIDMVSEGVDCVLRWGALPDSEMVARRLALLERLNCAAPAYLERFGTPAGIDALESEGHRMVALRSLSTGQLHPLEFQTAAGLRTLLLPSPVTVTGTESYLAVARLGFGIFQVPRFHAEADLARGALVQILPDAPPPPGPVSILYPRNRQLSPRVRVFIDWAAAQFAQAT